MQFTNIYKAETKQKGKNWYITKHHNVTQLFYAVSDYTDYRLPADCCHFILPDSLATDQIYLVFNCSDAVMW